MAYSKAFKTDSAYQLSITFYDNYQRKCGLTTTGARTVIPDRTYAFTNFVTAINWTLSNASALAEIPDWAYYYSVNITKCLRTRFFLQLRGLDATYVKKDNNGLFVLGNPAYSSIWAGCAFDISSLIPFNMGYVFAEGDIVKIYIGTDVYSLAIIGQQGNYIITELQDLGPLNGGTAFLFEIYTPYKPSTTEPGYEVAQIFPVTNPGTNTRAYSTLAGSIPGDVWLIDRTGPNRVVYTLEAGSIEDDGDHTIGVTYQSQDVVDTNFTTGNSPLQNLSGFDPATNNDRWIMKMNTAQTVRATGTIIVSAGPDGDHDNVEYEADFLDNLGHIWNIVPKQTLINHQVYTFQFSVDLPLAIAAKLFIWALETPGSSTTYQETTIVLSVLDNAVTYQAEAMSPNDKFYKNWFTDAGRVNNVDTLGQQVHENTIAFSNTLADGTKNNGLSTYDATDTKQIPVENGRIEKLQLTSKVSNEIGVVMLAICSKETSSMYIGEVQLLGALRNADVAQTADVIGTVNTLKGSYGTSNPESVVEYRGNVYWLDSNNGRFIQYSINGLFPISDYHMIRFWKLFSETYRSLTPQQIEALGSRPFVFTGIDPQNGELLVSVPRVLSVPPKGYMPGFPGIPYPFDIWDGQGKSIVYKLGVEPNWWQGSIDAQAEGFCYAGDQLWSFKAGQAYRHNSQAVLANFYGIQSTADAMWVMNDAPSRPKIANNITFESDRVPDFTFFMTEYPYIQVSELYPDQYDDKEGVFYAAILRDKLTPGVTEPLLRGDRLRSVVLKVFAEWAVSNNNQVNFKFADTGFAISRGHTT